MKRTEIASILAQPNLNEVVTVMGWVRAFRSNRFIALKGGPYATLEEAKKAGAATLNYGLFVNQILTFLIVAFAIFMVVKGINRMRRQAPAKA